MLSMMFKGKYSNMNFRMKIASSFCALGFLPFLIIFSSSLLSSRAVVRRVAVFWACQHSAPLASLLLAASWSFASVLPSFSLSDVQFSSSRVFGLGTLVTAGSVGLMCCMQSPRPPDRLSSCLISFSFSWE